MTTVARPTRFRVRPIEAGDPDGLALFYEDLSPDSRQARFHGATRCPSGRVTSDFCCVDHHRRQGIVAEALGANGHPGIVGHACIEPAADHVAEVAIAVADAWQHHGVGRALLAESIAWAQANGIVRLVACVRWSNVAMIGLIRSMGYSTSYGADECGVVDLSIDLYGGVRRVA
jgi:acetyltransferase